MAMGKLGMVSIKQQKEGKLRNHLWDMESRRDGMGVFSGWCRVISANERNFFKGK